MTDKAFYLRALRDEECVNCGRWKRSGNSFCYRCYKRLPAEMQKALWRRIGAGYEEAFEEAVRWLGEDERGGGHG